MADEVKNLWIYQTYDVFKTYDTGIKIDYIILMIVLFACAIVTGKKLQFIKNKKYWNTVAPFIFVFTTIEGLRYLRGVDYLNYALLFKYQGETSATEIIYLFVQQLFHSLNVPFWFPFVFYSFVWIVGFLYLLKEYRSKASYILPIFILLSLGPFETFIRQSFAWGFIFIFLAELLKKNYKHAFIFCVCSILIHNNSLIFIFIILAVYLLKSPIPPKYTIIFYVFGIIAFDVSNLNYVSALLSKIPSLGDTVFTSYLATADSWFSADAVRDKFERSFITKVGVAFFDISIFYLGYKQIKQNMQLAMSTRILFFYNLFCLNTVLLQFVFTIEILKRVFSAYYGFSAFVLAVFLLDRNIYVKYNLWCKFVMLFLIFFFVKQVLLVSNQLFVWDNYGIYNFNL